MPFSSRVYADHSLLAHKFESLVNFYWTKKEKEIKKTHTQNTFGLSAYRSGFSHSFSKISSATLSTSTLLTCAPYRSPFGRQSLLLLLHRQRYKQNMSGRLSLFLIIVSCSSFIKTTCGCRMSVHFKHALVLVLFLSLCSTFSVHLFHQVSLASTHKSCNIRTLSFRSFRLFSWYIIANNIPQHIFDIYSFCFWLVCLFPQNVVVSLLRLVCVVYGYV